MTGLKEGDFTFSLTTFQFLEIGVTTLMVERALDTVSFSGDPQSAAAPAPGILALFALGLIGIASGTRCRV